MGNLLTDLPVTIATWIIPAVISGVIDNAEPLIKAQLGGATRIVSDEISTLTPPAATVYDAIIGIGFPLLAVYSFLRGLVMGIVGAVLGLIEFNIPGILAGIVGFLADQVNNLNQK